MIAILVKTIEVSGKKMLAIYTPYSPELADAARKLSGRWNSTERAWTFDPRLEDSVRALLRSIYGTDGSDEGASDLVTIRTTVPNIEAPRNGRAEWFCFGRLLVSRPSKFDAVKLGQGVVLVKGDFYAAGGSEKYPELAPMPGTVIDIYDVPRATLGGEDDKYEIVGQTIDMEALRAEREKLMARIAEIDITLGKDNS